MIITFHPRLKRPRTSGSRTEILSLKVEWKEKKVQGVEEDVSLQRKQLELMENEMKRRENEVEERESEILMELTAMKEKMAEKDAKIESLNSDLMEV